MSEAEDKKIAALEQEVIAAQQMLYFVLATVGEVVVPKEALKHGIEDGVIISVDDDISGDAFVFKLVNVAELVDEQS